MSDNTQTNRSDNLRMLVEVGFYVLAGLLGFALGGLFKLMIIGVLCLGAVIGAIVNWTSGNKSRTILCAGILVALVILAAVFGDTLWWLISLAGAACLIYYYHIWQDHRTLVDMRVWVINKIRERQGSPLPNTDEDDPW